jgi:glycosyltransferase involved in cell wall biosynthesis
MLAHILSDPEFNSRFQHRLSFRASEEYNKGLSRKISSANLIALRLPSAERLSRMVFRGKSYAAQQSAAVLARMLEIPISIFDAIVLFRTLKETSPALLHINNGGYPGALSCRIAVVAAWLAGVPVQVMVVNNLAIKYQSSSRKFEWVMDRFVAKHVQKFVTGSAAASDRLGQVLRLPDDRRRVINNGVNLPTPEPAETFGDAAVGVRFGMVAHHVPRKGHMVLLKAIADLRDAGTIVSGDVKFFIEGSGAETEKIFEEISRLELSSFVVMIGTSDAVLTFMQTLDVLVLPSIGNEDFPNVISEAMGLGIPVIATKVGGIPEQVMHMETGLLVSAMNHQELADAIEFAIKNPEWRAKAGLQSLARFDASYRVELAVGRYIDLYDELIHGGVQ